MRKTHTALTAKLDAQADRNPQRTIEHMGLTPTQWCHHKDERKRENKLIKVHNR